MKSATAFVLGTGSKLAQIGCDATHLASVVTNAADDGLTAAKRAVRKSCRAIEDLTDEATIAIKRHPLKSVGIAFGVAFGVGTLAGWLVKHR